jgi:hypothetical protein
LSSEKEVQTRRDGAGNFTKKVCGILCRIQAADLQQSQGKGINPFDDMEKEWKVPLFGSGQLL